MFWADLFFLSEFCHHKIYTNLVFQIFSNCCFFSFYIFVVILILNTLNWSFDSSSASLDCSSPLPMIVIHNMENRPKEITLNWVFFFLNSLRLPLKILKAPCNMTTVRSSWPSVHMLTVQYKNVLIEWHVLWKYQLTFPLFGFKYMTSFL